MQATATTYIWRVILVMCILYGTPNTIIHTYLNFSANLQHILLLWELAIYSMHKCIHVQCQLVPTLRESVNATMNTS